MFTARYGLTPWINVLLEKLPGSQAVNKIPVFCGTRRFITAFTKARHLSLLWAKSIQSMPFHPISWRSVLILSSHLTSLRTLSLKQTNHISSLKVKRSFLRSKSYTVPNGVFPAAIPFLSQVRRLPSSDPGLLPAKYEAGALSLDSNMRANDEPLQTKSSFHWPAVGSSISYNTTSPH